MGGDQKVADGGRHFTYGDTIQATVSTSDTLLTLRARIVEQRRNIVVIHATLADSTGKVCTEATCTYFAFPKEKAERDMHFTRCVTENELP